MSTALVSINYSSTSIYEAMDEESQKLVRELLPRHVIALDDVKSEVKKVDEITGVEEKVTVVEKKWRFRGYEKFLLDGQQMSRLTDLGISFELHSFKGTMPYSVGNDAPVGTLHVHLPNYDLNSYNTVTWMEDACTEALQRMLDDGWRILAVCPPKSQRRPDYILGRHDKTKENKHD